MLSSTYTKGSYDVEIASQLLQQLSISLDTKYLKHKNVPSKPKLKRLLKIKYSSNSTNNSNVCFRCKREAFKHEQPSIPEKEVDVKKENQPKRVSFHDILFNSSEETGKDSEFEKLDNTLSEAEQCNDHVLPTSESVPSFQTVFFSQRPLIIGNNEFWLPQYSQESDVGSIEVSPSSQIGPNLNSETALPHDAHTSGSADKTNAISEFLRSIFQQSAKQEVKVLKVVDLIDGTIAILTKEHFFQCREKDNSYRVLEAVLLKDVRRIFVNDDCFMIVLEINHASILTEFKEFVPGLEKTETLVSLLVFTISRIRQNFLPEVTRLPIHLLPSCGRIKKWIINQEDEEILFSGILSAENISYLDHDLLDDNFMVKTSRNSQFHPVRISLRSGYISAICNGGCESNCKHSFCLELRNEITRIKRESDPWPNCIYISTRDFNITLNSSRKTSLDDLLEKIYFIIQCKIENSIKEFALIFVTEFYLQLFQLKGEKELICSFPKFNLEVKDDKTDNSCIIDSQGVEAAEVTDTLPLQNRWKLTFLSLDDKTKFLEATSEQLV